MTPDEFSMQNAARLNEIKHKQNATLQIFCALISNPTVFNFENDAHLTSEYMDVTKSLSEKMAKLFT